MRACILLLLLGVAWGRTVDRQEATAGGHQAGLGHGGTAARALLLQGGCGRTCESCPTEAACQGGLPKANCYWNSGSCKTCTGGVICAGQCVGLGQGLLDQKCCGNSAICGTGAPGCDPNTDKCACDTSTSAPCDGRCVGLGQGLLDQKCCGNPAICGTGAPVCDSSTGLCACDSSSAPCDGRCVGLGQGLLGQKCCGNSDICGTGAPVCDTSTGLCACSSTSAECDGRCVDNGQVILGGRCCGKNQLCGTNLRCNSAGTCECDPDQSVAECNNQCVGFGQGVFGAQCCPDTAGAGLLNVICGDGAPFCNSAGQCACDEVSSFACDGGCVGKGQGVNGQLCCNKAAICGSGAPNCVLEANGYVCRA